MLTTLPGGHHYSSSRHHHCRHLTLHVRVRKTLIIHCTCICTWLIEAFLSICSHQPSLYLQILDLDNRFNIVIDLLLLNLPCRKLCHIAEHFVSSNLRPQSPNSAQPSSSAFEIVSQETGQLQCFLTRPCQSNNVIVRDYCRPALKNILHSSTEAACKPAKLLCANTNKRPSAYSQTPPPHLVQLSCPAKHEKTVPTRDRLEKDPSKSQTE